MMASTRHWNLLVVVLSLPAVLAILAMAFHMFVLPLPLVNALFGDVIEFWDKYFGI